MTLPSFAPSLLSRLVPLGHPYLGCLGSASCHSFGKERPFAECFLFAAVRSIAKVPLKVLSPVTSPMALEIGAGRDLTSGSYPWCYRSAEEQKPPCALLVKV